MTYHSIRTEDIGDFRIQLAVDEITDFVEAPRHMLVAVAYLGSVQYRDKYRVNVGSGQWVFDRIKADLLLRALMGDDFAEIQPGYIFKLLTRIERI